MEHTVYDHIRIKVLNLTLYKYNIEGINYNY